MKDAILVDINRKENLFNMRKNINKIVGLTLCIGMLTGCAQTPESSLVKPKGSKVENAYTETEGVDMVNEDSSENTKDKNTAVRTTIRDLLNAPETYKSQTTDDSAKLVVNTDATVEIPDVEKISAISVTPAEVTQDLLDRITDAFFSEAKLYTSDSYYTQTKDEIKKTLDELKEDVANGNLDPYNYGTDEDGNYIYDIYGEIEMYEQEYESAPETKTLVEGRPVAGSQETENGTANGDTIIKINVTKFIDGVSDLIVGYLIDKTNTRWGKSRPWILFGAIPFGVTAVLAFSVPDIGQTGMLIYAYVTYILLSTSYTIVNIPMASILPALSENPHERTVLASCRTFFSSVGSTVVSAFALTLVDKFGNGNEALGFRIVMIIFGVIGCLVFFFCFFNTKERVMVQAEKVSLKANISCLLHNGPWKLFALNIVWFFGGYVIQASAVIYYFTYVVQNTSMVQIVATITTLVPIVTNLLAPFLVKLTSKRNLMIGEAWYMQAVFSSSSLGVPMFRC